MGASALCGISNMTELIIFRYSGNRRRCHDADMIVIGDLFTGKQRAKFQGLFGAIYGLASVISQIGAGLLTL